ncbi:hypothetical protein EG329_002361 [Mollisiaceae sp. DMI_Dod_QoI]|nr:hypothetical protein EG329_002361 [Helotiales sp. DMI_Dod_QoI]
MVSIIECAGTPHEIGFAHGSKAAAQVASSIEFYKWMFDKFQGLSWSDALIEAEKFVEPIKIKWPRYYEEMQGLAIGAGVSFLDVVALNVRSEIAFGLFSKDTSKPMESDGCTSLAWRTTNGKSVISQNWDWMSAQKKNVVVLNIKQIGTELPEIKMATEAGMIGKIGFNSLGVGCCMNAIRAKGIDASRMPVHFGSRTILESKSTADAVAKLKKVGIASSIHLLIADPKEAVGLECTSTGFEELRPDKLGRLCHANNLLAQHPPEVYEPLWLKDSPLRTARMREIATSDVSSKASFDTILDLYKDETTLPGAINRQEAGDSRSATLFNIIVDLSAKKGVLSMGRPTEIEEQITLEF